MQVAQLPQRDRAAGWVRVMAKSAWLELGDNIYGHYRSILNHCDAIGQQRNRIRWKTQNKGYYAVQGHLRSSRLVSIESQYATSY